MGALGASLPHLDFVFFCFPLWLLDPCLLLFSVTSLCIPQPLSSHCMHASLVYFAFLDIRASHIAGRSTGGYEALQIESLQTAAQIWI